MLAKHNGQSLFGTVLSLSDDTVSVKLESGDDISCEKSKVAKPIETPEDMFKRVAKSVASAEEPTPNPEKEGNNEKWTAEFFSLLSDFKFIPGGRILASAGSEGLSFYNCFVIPSPTDCREGIIETLQTMIEIMSRGGGVGVNISSLRPFEHVRLVPAADVVELAQQCDIHRGQKNHNLVTTLPESPAETEVYAFIDADACPMRDWLRKLITPLTTNDPKLGAVTSARIYSPGSGLASYTQAVWVLGTALFLVGPWRYVWGGGFALPKAVFDTAKVLRHWDGTEGFIANDDLNLTIALRRHGYHVRFVPDCLLLRRPPALREDWRAVLRFTNRQLLHVWWVRRDLWLVGLLTQGIKTLAVLCSLIVALWQPIGLLALIAPLMDIFSGWIAANALSSDAPQAAEVRQALRKVILFAPLASGLGTINILTALVRRRMRWGGVEYSKRTVIGRTKKK